MATMNFFQRRDEARKNTGCLMFLSMVSVCELIGILWMFATYVYGLLHSHYYGQWYQYFEPSLLMPVSGATIIIIATGWFIKSCELAAGGRSIANMFHARLVSQGTTNFAEKTLLNVVEEMSIASQTPMPQVYVLDGELGINAFAAGYSRGDTVICVTEGALKQLNRDELEGVIGHEFSHILNGDMALNMQMMALVFGITCLAEIGYVTMRVGAECTGGSSSKAGSIAAAACLIGLAVMIIGFAGALMGAVLQAAISRQRESLADAASAQYTRNPIGLRNALLKIAGLPQGSQLTAPNKGQVNHFLFAQGGGLSDLFATHPPLAQRIKELDPRFDLRTLPEQAQKLLEAQEEARISPPDDKAAATVASFISKGVAAPAGFVRPPARDGSAPMAVLSSAAPPTSAGSPLQCLGMPQSVRAAARDLLGAYALVLGLILSSDPSIRAQQLEAIKLQANNPAAAELHADQT